MRVPTEYTVDLVALHGLVARDDVLGIAGQQVAIVRQAVGERRSVEEDEFVLAVVAGRTAFNGLLEGVVLIPVVEHGFLQLGEAGVRRDVGALLAGSSLRIHMIGGFAHRMLLVWRFHYLPYEDDGFRAIAHVRHRGCRTSLLFPRRLSACAGFVRPLDIRLFGPTPPVLLSLARKRRPFFRKLPADDGSSLFVSNRQPSTPYERRNAKSRTVSTMRLS